LPPLLREDFQHNIMLTEAGQRSVNMHEHTANMYVLRVCFEFVRQYIVCSLRIIIINIIPLQCL